MNNISKVERLSVHIFAKDEVKKVRVATSQGINNIGISCHTHVPAVSGDVLIIFSSATIAERLYSTQDS